MTKRTALTIIVFGVGVVTNVFAAEKAGQWRVESKGGAVIVTGNDMRVDFRQSTAWTIARIVYRGVQIVGPHGSQGTVITWKKKFVGTGHGGEVVHKFIVQADEKEYEIKNNESMVVSAQEVSVIKESTIGPFHHTAEIVFPGNGQYMIYHYRYRVEQPLTDFGRMYAFMHCVENQFKDYIAILPDNSILQDRADKEDGRFILKKDVKTVVYYSKDDKIGIAFVYPEVYQGAVSSKDFVSNMIWDRKNDNKLYFNAAIREKGYKVGDEFEYHLKVIPFISEIDQWKSIGKKFAAETKEEQFRITVPRNAEAYYLYVLQMLDDIERQLPSITKSANAAAQWYIQDESLGLGADGNAAFVYEAQYRSGGLIGMLGRSPEKDWRGILIYCLRENHIDEDIERLIKYRNKGCRIILFGSANLLQHARTDLFKPDAEIIVPAAVNSGLFQNASGQWVIPTYETAAMASLWVWTAEFVGSCTRKGKMPPMYQSIRVPGAKERNANLMNIRFQEPCPQEVKEGELALRWMSALKKRLAVLHEKQKNIIIQIANQANATRGNGRKVFAVTGGHGVGHILDTPYSSGFFTHLDPRMLDPKKTDSRALFKKGDFLLIVDYDHIFNDAGNFHLVDRFREAGGTMAFCIATYRKDQIEQLKPEDIILDTGWEYGDADVELLGYDVKILPTSGVLTATAFFMIETQTITTEIDGKNPVLETNRIHNQADR